MSHQSQCRPLSTHPFDDDKLHEECGVFGIYGTEDAAAHSVLGLHALQHRGQEAAGITAFDGKQFVTQRQLGLVADNFTSEKLIGTLKGDAAIGHVRYSTAGGSSIRNVQPLFADLATGGFAVSHNGNLTNAWHLRRQLVKHGSIFQSTSDSEVIIHLVATSGCHTLLDKLIDALHKIEGAYSLVTLTREGLMGVRDPLGVRPLVLGKLGDATSCARKPVRWIFWAPAMNAMWSRAKLSSSIIMPGCRQSAPSNRSSNAIRALVSSSMFIFPVPTALWTACPFMMCANALARNWPVKQPLMRMW
nr:hypothetical protein [Iodidimonas gelatinilytica]